jgi:hypothetical protein
MRFYAKTPAKSICLGFASRVESGGCDPQRRHECSPAFQGWDQIERYIVRRVSDAINPQ